MSRFTLLCLFTLACSLASAEKGIEAVVGGNYARTGDFKYHVSVHFGDQRCGGAIIADQYILTAAHCVTDGNSHINVRRYTVIGGTHNLHDKHDLAIVAVETVYIPKNFKRFSLLNDIAVLKLKHGLKLSQHRFKLAKVHLPKYNGHYENAAAIVSGFGDQEMHIRINSQGQLEEFGGKYDGKLKFALVRVLSHQSCKELNHMAVPSSDLCGQTFQEKKHHFAGVCDGDSGGPMVYSGEIIGVLSLSPTGCNEVKKSAVYTRVASYLNFINSVIHGHPGPDVAWANVPH